MSEPEKEPPSQKKTTKRKQKKRKHLVYKYFNNGFLDPCYCRQLPTSLEELLEYQWEQGAQFLMQQASQYDGTLEYEFSILIFVQLLQMLVVGI